MDGYVYLYVDVYAVDFGYTYIIAEMYEKGEGSEEMDKEDGGWGIYGWMDGGREGGLRGMRGGS